MLEFPTHWRRDRAVGWTLRLVGLIVWVILVVELCVHPEWVMFGGSISQFVLYGLGLFAGLGIVAWMAGGAFIKQARKDRASENWPKDLRR